MKRVIVYILFLFIFIRCGEKVEEFDGFVSIEIEQLMASLDSKTWLRTERSIDGEMSTIPCEDSLLFVFTRPISGVTDENVILLAYNPFTCDSVGFCQQYPNICEEMVSFCEEETEFCDDLQVNLFFAGTWHAIVPPDEGDETDQVQINFPKDTTIVTVNDITSKEMEFTYTKTIDGQEREITEKFITEQ